MRIRSGSLLGVCDLGVELEPHSEPSDSPCRGIVRGTAKQRLKVWGMTGLVVMRAFGSRSASRHGSGVALLQAVVTACGEELYRDRQGAAPP